MIKSILIGSFTVLLGALFTSIIPRKQKERERFNIAYDAFKSSFNPTIQIIESSSRVEADYVAFPGHFANQDAAVVAFSDHLTGKRRSRIFQEKWKEYKAHQERFTEDYGMCVISMRPYGPELRACIYDLLKIAKKHWYDL